jgi:hypothetical protein
VLTKPVGFLVLARFAIETQKQNALRSPKPGEVDRLKTAVGALVNSSVSPKTLFVSAAYPLNPKTLMGAKVLSPELSFELFLNLREVDFPPRFVAGVESVCESGNSPRVVDDNDTPIGACKSIAVVFCETGAARNDTNGVPPPSTCGSVDCGPFWRTVRGKFGCARLSLKSSSAM